MKTEADKFVEEWNQFCREFVSSEPTEKVHLMSRELCEKFPERFTSEHDDMIQLEANQLKEILSAYAWEY